MQRWVGSGAEAHELISEFLQKLEIAKVVQEMAGGQSLDEAQSEGGCQHGTLINTLSLVQL